MDRPENWKELFLAALHESPNVFAAARTAGVSRRNAYAARESDSEFAAAWDDAIQRSVDDLEASAFRRAEESDTLTIFLLKSHRREVYGDPAKQPPPVTELRVVYQDRPTPEAPSGPADSD
jgi:hypothetical protein